MIYKAYNWDLVKNMVHSIKSDITSARPVFLDGQLEELLQYYNLSKEAAYKIKLELPCECNHRYGPLSSLCFKILLPIYMKFVYKNNMANIFDILSNN